MSCYACLTFQDSGRASYYYRWKNANIEIRGCEQHVKEVFEALNLAQQPTEGS